MSTTPYITVDQLKDLLGHKDQEQVSDSTLTQIASDGARAINDYCGRTFSLVTETRPFDAPPSERLLVADLATVTSLSWYGSTLVDGTDYMLIQRGGLAGYQILMRMYLAPGALVPVTRRWDWDPATLLPKGQPFGAMQIAGVWAYEAVQDPTTLVWAAVIPEKIARANEVLSARLWEMRELLYTGGGGAGGNLGRRTMPVGLLDDTVKDLLNGYVLEPMPRKVGNPYAD